MFSYVFHVASWATHSPPALVGVGNVNSAVCRNLAPAPCRNKAPCPSLSLILLDPACASVPMLFFSPSGIFLYNLPLTRSLFRARLVVALRWLAFYVHAVLAFPYHMVILMLPFASIILFVAA